MASSFPASQAKAEETSRQTPLKLPLLPRHPERVCWGCDKYCAADALFCGNGTERTPHPCELFGDDWFEWAQPRE